MAESETRPEAPSSAEILAFPGVAARADIPEDARRRLAAVGAATKGRLPPEFADLLVLRPARPRAEDGGRPAWHLVVILREEILDLREAGALVRDAAAAAGIAGRLADALEDELRSELAEGNPIFAALAVHGASLWHDRPAVDRERLRLPPSLRYLRSQGTHALHALRCLSAALLGSAETPGPDDLREPFAAGTVPILLYGQIQVHGRILGAVEGRPGDGLLTLEGAVARSFPIEDADRETLAGFEDQEMQRVPRVESGVVPGPAERERLLAAALLLVRMLERTLPAAQWQDAVAILPDLARILRDAAGTGRLLRRARAFELPEADGDDLLRDPGEGGAPVPRNAPCPCGSGRKWKKCCGA